MTGVLTARARRAHERAAVDQAGEKAQQDTSTDFTALEYSNGNMYRLKLTT